MKLHPSYIADLQTITPLDNLWLKSSMPMFLDTACTLPVDNPCSLEIITLADIRFKDNPTLTIVDSKGNELYVTQPILVEDSFASSTPATPAQNWDELVGKPSTFAPSAHNQDWSTITTGRPTTLAGYGITDAFTQTLADARYPQLSVQYTNPTWLAGIDATTIKTGTIDLARLPAMPSANTIVCTTIPAMTSGDQALVAKGTVVIESTTGNTYRYSGTGSVVLNASYIQQSDLTPDWSVITNKPTLISTWTNDSGYLTPAIYGTINTWTAKQNFADTSAYGYGNYTLWGNSGYDKVIDVRKKTDTSARIALYENGTLLFGDGAGATLGTLVGVTYGLSTSGNFTVGGTLISTYCAQFTNAWIGENSAENQVDTVGMRNSAIATAVAGYSPTSHTHTFASLTSKPTTLAGYGITDAATSTHNHDSTYFKLAAGSIHGTGTYTALYPTLAVGDGQYGMSASGGALNLYSVGGIKVFTRSGSADAVFAGNVWHSGNLGFGTSAGSMCQGNDSRLSDARTPNNNAAIVQGSVNNSGAYGKRTTGLGNTALAVDGLLDSGFYDANGTGTPLGNWTHIINSAHNNSYSGNQYQFQFAASFDNSISTLLNSGSGNWGGEGYWVRTINTSGKGAWRKLWHSGNLVGNQGTTHTHDQYLTTATASSTYLPLAGGTMATNAVIKTNFNGAGNAIQVNGNSWTGINIATTGANGAYITFFTPGGTGSYWGVQKRDAADYGTSVGCFVIEDNAAGDNAARFPIWIAQGVSGKINFNRTLAAGNIEVNSIVSTGGINANSGSIFTNSSVTAGSFIMSGGTATGFLMSNGTKLEKNTLNYFADGAWAGPSSAYGWAASTGANTRFGFSNSGTYTVDVYADGNFYATDSMHRVWHAGDFSLSTFASASHTHTKIEVSYDNEIVIGNGFNNALGKLYVNWRGAGTNRISDYMLCDGKGAGVFSYITAAGFKLNGGTGDNLLADNGSSVAVSSFALAGHNHNSTYAPLVHNHDSAYFKLNPASTQTVTGASTIFTSPIEARGASVFVADVALDASSYTNAALEVSRSTNNNTYHAGIGFHNAGNNAAYLYYSNSTGKFRFRRNSPDDLGLWDSSDFSSANIGNWNTAWTRVAGGRLCEDAYTGEDSLDWISRMNRGNHWGRINGVHSAPSYYNYMLIRETTGTKYSVIGCSADGNWYVGAAASNANLTTYHKIWTTEAFSATAVNRINNSDNNYGFSRLYRADYQNKYYLKHRWTTGGWNGNSWRLECANDESDSQSGIFTVVTNYADVGNTAYTLTAKGGTNNGANIDTGFMGNYSGLWAGSVDAPTGSTPFGNSWTWLQEWGHSDGGWRAQLGIYYFSDSLAYRRKENGTWKPWRYCVTTDASGNLPSLKVPGGKTLTIDGSLLCNNTVSYTVTGSDLTGTGPYDIGDYSRNVVACPVATTIQLQTSTYSYFKIVHAIGGTVAVTAAGGATIKRGTGGSNTSYNIGAGGTAICGYTPGFGFWLGWLY